MALFCFILLTINAAWGQTIAADSRLILYELDQSQGKYILDITPASSDRAPLLVTGDTFSIQPHGAACWVVMTNVCILQTRFDSSSSNGVVQINMRSDVFKLPFSEHTKLTFKNTIIELSKVKIDAFGETNMRTYEGENALSQLKKMGLAPPDDMDVEKAAGNHKQN